MGWRLAYKAGGPAGAKAQGSPRPAEEGLVLTSSLASIGEDNDVIKRPCIVGMRWVEGKLGCFLSLQGHQEGGVDHRDPEAALALAVLSREVFSCASIVALRERMLGAQAKYILAQRP